MARDSALQIARDFQRLLGEMESAYRPDLHLDMRWVLKDQELLARWIGMIESARSEADINELWKQVRDISHLMGCAIDDALGQRYRELEQEFFDQMLALVASARKASTG